MKRSGARHPFRGRLRRSIVVALSMPLPLIQLGGCKALGTNLPTPANRPQTANQHDQTAAEGSGAAAPGAEGVPEPFDELTVNSESVSAADLVKDHRDELEAKAKSMSIESFRAWLERRGVDLITDKIAEMLLYQRAKLRLPADSDKRIESVVDAEVRRIVATEFDGIPARYERHLATQRRTLSDARQKIRREILVASFLEAEIKPKIGEPTRAELLAAYQATGDSFRRAERRQMSLIEVRAPTAEAGAEGSPDARAAARQRIQAAQTALRAGEPFADVAREYSEGSRAADGGSWGWVTRGSVRERYVPAVEVLYQLKANEVSGITETDDMIFLVRCDALEPGVDPDFASVQPQLREQWTRDRFNTFVVDLVNTLRRDARIEPRNLDGFHAAVVREALNLVAIPGP